MKTIEKNLLIMLSIILICSCEKEIEPEIDQDQEIDEENVITTNYFDYDDFITDGLIAYYPFNGDANDASGNGLDGIAKNVSYSLDRFDQLERACLFNGINSYIEIDNSELLNGSIYTICFWYRIDSTDTLEQSIISKSDTARYGFTLGISKSTTLPDLFFAFKDKIGFEGIQGLGSWWVDGIGRKFYFAAVAFNETDFIAYGHYRVSRNPALFFNSNENKLFIGTSANGKYKNYSGELDDLLIYNRILTYEEVEKLSEWKIEQ